MKNWKRSKNPLRADHLNFWNGISSQKCVPSCSYMPFEKCFTIFARNWKSWPPRTIIHSNSILWKSGHCYQSPGHERGYHDIIIYCKTEDSCLRNCLLSVFGFEKDTSITDCNCWSFCRSQYFCEECVVWFDEQALMSGQLMWSEEIWIKLIFMYFTFYFFSNTDKKIDDNF